MHSLNIFSILTTDDIFEWDKLTKDISSRPTNKFSILFKDEASKYERSISYKGIPSENIFILVADDILIWVIYASYKLEHPLSMPSKLITDGAFK